jgi:glycosyltransferase involved in cell wall biosynthesis
LRISIKIAIYHNLASGGNKRELYEFSKRLKKDGNIIYLYGNLKEEGQYLDLSKFVDEVLIYHFKKIKYISFTLPYLKSILNLLISFYNIFNLIKISKKMAKNIDRENFDYVFIHQSKDYVQAPFLISFLKTRSIFFCAEPQRTIYDKGLFDKLRTGKIRQNSFFKNIYTKSTNIIDKICKKILIEKIKKYDFKNISNSDIVLTNSYFSRENILSSYGVDSTVVHLGGDIFDNNKNLIQKKNQVITIGSINPIKCFDLIILSIANIRKEIRPKLLIVGNAVNGLYLKKLKRISSENNVDISVKVNITDLELKNNIQQSRLFVYAPYLEPLGLAPLEAMSLGLPVIGIKEGGIRETIKNNYNGFLVHRDIEIFSKKITELITDNNKYRLMKQNSIDQVIKYWNWDSAYERLLKAIN